MSLQSYKACYNRLREFVHSSKKTYKDELGAVLFPVIFWLVFELLTYSGNDGAHKIAAAHALLDAVSAEHYEQYKRELLALRSVSPYPPWAPRRGASARICKLFRVWLRLRGEPELF